MKCISYFEILALFDILQSILRSYVELHPPPESLDLTNYFDI